MSDINKSMQSSRHLPHGSPESEFSNFECYQNYTAPEVFVQHIAGIVNQSDVQTIVRGQKQMLQRFEKTNEMLLNCNALSNARLKAATDDFRKHIKLINEVKRDLEYIYRKIRHIKARTYELHPDAAAKAEQKMKANSLCEDGQEVDDECAMAMETPSTSTAPNRPNKNLVKSDERKSSKGNDVTVDYIQMGHMKIDIESGIAANDTDNESSDTSDT